jgi:hypothetical protein
LLRGSRREAGRRGRRAGLFGREQGKATGLPPEFHLCGGRGGESNIGQSLRKRGIACLIKGGKPVVQEVAGGDVGDEAQLGAEARKANENGGVNGADVGSGASGHRSVGGIADNDGVDLVWAIRGQEDVKKSILKFAASSAFKKSLQDAL